MKKPVSPIRIPEKNLIPLLFFLNIDLTFRKFAGLYYRKQEYDGPKKVPISSPFVSQDKNMEDRQEDFLIAENIQAHPEVGFRMLMAKYKEPIYWHIRRIVETHDDAQDAMQETFLRIFRSIGQYRKDCSFAAWIYRIATNESLRIISGRKQTLSLEECPASEATVGENDLFDWNDRDAALFQKAIHSLPTRQQIVFNMRYYDELPYEDIAQVIGSTPSAAKASYHLAKEKIIRIIKELYL